MFDEEQFAEALTPGATSQLDLVFECGRVPGRLTAPRGKPRALVIGFHGAARRAQRTLPFFFPRYEFLAEDCYQYHPCDPELFIHPDLPTSWFVGSRERPLQRMLPKAFKELAKRLKVERVIYVGGSAGGFAALYYSKGHPRSIAVVMQPQTNPRIYDEKTVAEYIETCWTDPETGDVEPPMLNLDKVYSKVRRNSILYLQSSGDWHHYRHHFLPFIERFREQPDQFLFACDAWDPPGHRPLPIDLVVRWLRAAVEAKSHKAQDILAARYRVENFKDAQIFEEDRSEDGEVAAVPRQTSIDMEELSEQLTQLLLERKV